MGLSLLCRIWLGIRDDYRTLIGLDDLEVIEGANDDEKLDSGDA